MSILSCLYQGTWLFLIVMFDKSEERKKNLKFWNRQQNPKYSLFKFVFLVQSNYPLKKKGIGKPY